MGTWVRRNWGDLLSCEPELTPLAKAWFGFQFKSKDDTEKILGQVWNFGTTPFKLQRWTPLFDVDIERLDMIPVWVRLPRLPREFWNQTSLSDIGRALGTFTEADLSYLQTKRRTVARILVSLNIRTSLRDHINLIWEPKIRKQLLDYEGLPFRCHKCDKTGHMAKQCPQAMPPAHNRKRWTNMGSRVPREEEEDAIFEGAGWKTSTTPPGQLTGPF